MKKIEVVAGIIFFQNEILCVQRSKNKFFYISEKFEFPGGKIENGETKEEALQRELSCMCSNQFGLFMLKNLRHFLF